MNALFGDSGPKIKISGGTQRGDHDIGQAILKLGRETNKSSIPTYALHAYGIMS